MHIGEKIRELRARRGLSQDELGQLIDGQGRQISRYENGHVRPGPLTVARMAEVLGVEPAELMSDRPPPPGPSQPRPPRRRRQQAPPAIPTDKELASRFVELAKLPPNKREAVLLLLDSVIRSHRVEQAMGPLQLPPPAPDDAAEPSQEASEAPAAVR